MSADPVRHKPLDFVGSSRDDLRKFPKEVRIVMGTALNSAQLGGKHPAAKPLKGFGGAGVLEIVDDFDGETYRAVYTVKFANVVYVLHEEISKANRNAKERDRSDTAALQVRRSGA